MGRAILYLPVLIFLAACSISMSRQEQVENILPAPSIETSIAEAKGAFSTDAWPDAAWWKQYGVDELNALIELALSNNPTIQAVQERIQFAKQQAIVVRSDLFPLLYFDANDEWEYLSKNGFYRALNPNISLNNNQINFDLSCTYEIDFWGKYRNLYRAALGKTQAAIAESAQVELSIATTLAQSYFALRTNLLRKSLYDALYQIRKSYFDLQTKMMQHALYSKLTPLLSEEDLLQAEQWVLQITKEIEVDKHIVNVLTGRGPDEPLALTGSLPPLPKTLSLPKTISTELLSRRPDLMAQIWRVEALAHEVGAARADYFPNINLIGFGGYQSGTWSKLFEWASKTIGLIPGLKLPIFTAGAIGAHADAKKAEFNEAVYFYNDLILKSFQQVSDLISIGKAVMGEKEKQREIVSAAQKRFDLFHLRKQKGLENALTVYRIQEELIFKQLEDIQWMFQQYVVSISLIKALGGGYCSDEMPL